MKKSKTIILILTLIFAAGCASTGEKATEKKVTENSITVTGPDAIIYKTRADYRDLVPVIMNSTKDDIVSYPAPGDLRYKGNPALPTELANGYLLDNRGINENVAFLSITYPEYMAFEETPSKETLTGMILDSDPLTEMYNCGKRQKFSNEVDELNAIILEGDFSNFTKLR